MQRTKVSQGDKIGTCIFINDIGSKKVGKNTVRRISLFRCVCNNEFEAEFLNVKYGNTKSCGCLITKHCIKLGKNNIVHGRRTHPLYKTWVNMLSRCYNFKNSRYPNYGGRGITVCDRWLDVNNFIEDVFLTHIVGYQLDRIDNNKGYSPENCRWATNKENCNNTRKNKIIEYKKENKTLSEWADFLNIKYSVLHARLNKLNWTVEKTFSTPILRKK